MEIFENSNYIIKWLFGDVPGIPMKINCSGAHAIFYATKLNFVRCLATHKSLESSSLSEF